jgi:phosphoribosyl 1,2-cyclic phosphodiesterase
MKVISLQSGSNGNCIYVEANNVRLLFDAGISGRQAELRLAARGRDIADVHALLISHDHRDHIRCAGVFQRKWGLPVYATRRTLEAANAYRDLGPMSEVHHFQAGGGLLFDEVCVEAIATPHDGADGVAFVVDDGCHRLGILTDLGHVFERLKDVVRSLDAVVLESNYDPVMLAQGSYPEFLKDRIRGPRGHLSNNESADLLRYAAGGQLRWACLAHLSAENNTPELALQHHRRVLGYGLPLYVASRYDVSQVLEV